MTAPPGRALLHGGAALLPFGAPGGAPGGGLLPLAMVARTGAPDGPLAGPIPPPPGPALLVAGTLALVGALRLRRRVTLPG